MNSLDDLKDDLTGERERLAIDEAKRKKSALNAAFAAGELQQEALTDLLIDLQFFNYAHTPDEVALKNQATRTLYDMGVFVADKKQCLRVVQAMLSVRR